MMKKKLIASSVVATMLVAGTFGTAAFAAAKPAKTNTTAAAAATASSNDADKLVAFAQSLQGKVHYSYGQRNTSNPNNLTLDCSSYTQYVFQQALGIKIPWGSNAQYNAYQHIDKSQLKKKATWYS